MYCSSFVIEIHCTCTSYELCLILGQDITPYFYPFNVYCKIGLEKIPVLTSLVLRNYSKWIILKELWTLYNFGPCFLVPEKCSKTNSLLLLWSEMSIYLTLGLIRISSYHITFILFLSSFISCNKLCDHGIYQLNYHQI